MSGLPYGAVCVRVSDLEVDTDTGQLEWVVLAYEDQNGQVIELGRLEGDELAFPTKAKLAEAIRLANINAGCPR